ncbi:hypothetical protein [Salmonella enterica]|nr:hypothetical protein [Salmonella enterica]
MAHWVLKQWPQLALDAISQITFQMDNKHSTDESPNDFGKNH